MPFAQSRTLLNRTHTTALTSIRSVSDERVVMNGTAWVDETFVQIRWGWAAFLASQIALSYVFLAVTMWRTRRLGMPVVKSSELATLLAPADEVRVAVGTLAGFEEAEERAERTLVRLDGDGRLVLVGGKEGVGK